MAVNLSPIGGVAAQFLDNSGNPLTGGKIFTYAAGTTTPQSTYTSANGATPHANPIILDAAGRVPGGEIWLTNGLQYKFLIKTSADVQIGSYDNIFGVNSVDAEQINYTPPFTNSVATNVEAKLAQTVSVADFGAVGDGVTDDSAAIQAAINFAASNGSRTVFFPKGRNKTTGTAYNLGSTTITIPAAEMKLVGQKYTQITKTGAGAFFNLPVQGYGFEAEGLWLVGNNVNGQYGFLISGIFNGSYQQGILEAHIHDCWFEAIGKKETADETAGGAILVTCQSLGLKVEGNICSQGGYLLRVEQASDGIQVKHNVTNISRSVAVQFVNTQGAASVEISNNNFANVGGAVFLKKAGYCNVFGNASLPGESEAGALGAVVKRTINGDGSVSLTEDAVTGVSASFWFDLAQFPNVSKNVCAYSGIAQDADYGFYFSSRQATAFISDNYVDSPTLKGLYVWPGQPLVLLNNRTSSLSGGNVYSAPTHPGIMQNYLQTTPSYAQRQGFGTETPITPFEFTCAAATPSNGTGQIRVSNSADTNEGIAFGWDNAATQGYLYAHKIGVGYQTIRLGSNTVVNGYSGDTTFVVQGGAGQGSNLFRIANSAGTNLFMIGPLGLGVFADNAAATAGGVAVGQLYRTATGDVKIRY